MTEPLSNRRWYRLSPDRFVAGLLSVVCLLWLSEEFQWFGFSHHKGWAVLFAVAAAGIALTLMVLWWAASLLFHSQFQFGIRTLLALMLLCSIALGWLAEVMKQARRQAETVEWIKSVGPRVAVYYDWESDANGNFGSSQQQPPEPEWLREVLGDDFFSAVAVVVFRTRITDAALEHISGLKQLGWLVLNNSKITDAGLRHLVDLPGLKRLELMGAQITDAGMEDLERFSHVRVLYLNCSRITDAGLEHLRGFVHLRRLDLDGDQIADAGVGHLKGLAQLEELDLCATNVTDAGLEDLEGLTQLQVLDLRDTKITTVGVKNLQKALPNCQLLTNLPILETLRRQ